MGVNEESSYDKAYKQLKKDTLATVGKHGLNAFQVVLILSTLIDEIRDLGGEF